MKTALIIIGVIIVLLIYVGGYSLCVISKRSDARIKQQMLDKK